MKYCAFLQKIVDLQPRPLSQPHQRGVVPQLGRLKSRRVCDDRYGYNLNNPFIYLILMRMKKIYLFLSMVMFALTTFAQAWDGTSRTAWVNGEGTAANPYLIETPAHLVYLSDRVVAGETFEGKHFRLTTNLDMGGVEFPAIGKFDKSVDPVTNQETEASLYFLGVFDGNYHTIDNLLITKAPGVTGSIEGQEMSLGGAGLFACSNNGTVIRNLIIGAKSRIDVASDVVGAIIGKMEGGTLENSANLGVVSANTFAGGLVGAMTGNAIIQNCANKGTVSTTGMQAGGIVAQLEQTSKVVASYNTGAVNCNSFYGGGITGLIWDQIVIANVYNLGKVTSPASFMGTPQAIVSDVDGSAFKVEKALYVQELTAVGDTYGTNQTVEEMKSDAALEKLNAGLETPAFVKDATGINNGFPILAWEASVAAGLHRLEGAAPISGNATVVYNLSGQVVATGATAQPTQPGVYLVVRPGQPAMKMMVK